MQEGRTERRSEWRKRYVRRYHRTKNSLKKLTISHNPTLPHLSPAQMINFVDEGWKAMEYILLGTILATLFGRMCNFEIFSLYLYKEIDANLIYTKPKQERQTNKTKDVQLKCKPFQRHCLQGRPILDINLKCIE